MREANAGVVELGEGEGEELEGTMGALFCKVEVKDRLREGENHGFS